MPWKSKKEARWGNSPSGLKALGGKAKVAEWNSSTDFKTLPETTTGIQKQKVKPMAENKKKNWIAGAIKHKGSLRAAAARSGKSTRAFASEHKHDSGITGKRSRLAETLMAMHK